MKSREAPNNYTTNASEITDRLEQAGEEWSYILYELVLDFELSNKPRKPKSGDPRVALRAEGILDFLLNLEEFEDSAVGDTIINTCTLMNSANRSVYLEEFAEQLIERDMHELAYALVDEGVRLDFKDAAIVRSKVIDGIIEPTPRRTEVS